MLARITGVLERVDRNIVTIAPPAGRDPNAPGPLAYDVLVPAFVAEDLDDHLGHAVTLHTVQLFEGAAQGGNLTPRLIGFLTRNDRAFFELFTTVKGVGSRKALRAMTAPPSQIALAIAQQDVAALKKLPEIGQRLAATIVAELAGKAERFVVGDPATTSDRTPTAASSASETRLAEPAQQAVEALVRLGTPRVEAERKVLKAVEHDPDLSRDHATADHILTAALSVNA
jgi:Holliday junction DNA helicase RuvA